METTGPSNAIGTSVDIGVPRFACGELFAATRALPCGSVATMRFMRVGLLASAMRPGSDRSGHLDNEVVLQHISAIAGWLCITRLFQRVEAGCA